MLTTFILGIILGLLWTFFNGWLFFKIAKIKCPMCKQLKSLKEIFVFSLKTREITGKPYLKCRQIKPQIDIS